MPRVTVLMEVVVVPSTAAERLDHCRGQIDVIDLEVQVEAVLADLGLGHALHADAAVRPPPPGPG